ncbi:MAG: Ti-type conjugative transfer relaxase TraA [Phenylobacterium sp.]|uniref:Ti-type conjugative transfer relaxase TraA n=1 Tax=Phenylobacterium sp. TaxID=1871053 RepID=UPI001B7864EE|nr:Ti-type conjugative transfer relaxase TraA [Phenylobacterium sp.]MBP7818252.1 Ti-type conjugative transfer relaxase TraA [Phenylobacterium sp.]
MAIYHFSAKVISRANGSSAVASAAYRSASRLEDERLGRSHDFTSKTGVVHSEIIAPEGSPERWQDRETLWNEVEAGEVRKDAQLAREIEFSIPREMNQAQGVELARDFVQQEFVDRGMVADLNVHWDVGPDGLAKPHAHVMLSMREAKPEGQGTFGKKVREWNSTDHLTDWREAWAEHVNTRLAELDIDARVDHRTLEAQGIDLEPQHKIGPAGARRLDRGEDAERADDHREIARRNGERIIAEPDVALDAITRQQSTFTDHDLARFVHRHTDDADQFSQAMSAVKTSPELVALGKDGAGRERFSTREMLAIEQRLERSAEQIAGRGQRRVSPASRELALAASEGRGLALAGSQRDALDHITGREDLALVVGYAGTGKSAMLGVAREAWEASGYQVRGAALSGIAAESLEAGSGIGSRTIASLEHGWAQGRDVLTARDVLVIDEAGMIGSRQMERVLSAADLAGAKVVLVGDAEQLQAIEAGAAFRALTERHGAAEITEIRRQREDWQREATRELATGRTGAALDRYEAAGMVSAHETREAARSALVDGWDTVRQARPEASQVMLAHTRADVAELNQLARGRMRAAGALGEDQVIQTERGARTFAPGDRVMFLRNERSMGVKNGSLGTVEKIDGASLAVRLDGADRREVRFDLKDYAQIDHGYASTIHKSQGVTVDHGHLLASDGLDRHAAYVGMSRHRETLAVHYGADDFKDRAQLTRTLGRERAKDTTLDYGEAFAERRGLVRSEILAPRSPAPEVGRAPKRSMFDGLKLGRGGGPAAGIAEAAERAAPGHDAALQRGITRYTAAWADAERMGEQGLPILPHQRVEMQKAREGLEGVSSEATADLRAALSRNPGLARQGAMPEGMKAVQRAMATERTVRLDPAARAERFVEDWRGLQERRAELGVGYQTADARKAIEGRMKAMADGLGRDAQVESILRGKKLELGLGKVRDMPGVSMGDALVRSLTLGRSIGLGR